MVRGEIATDGGWEEGAGDRRRRMRNREEEPDEVREGVGGGEGGQQGIAAVCHGEVKREERAVFMDLFVELEFRGAARREREREGGGV